MTSDQSVIRVAQKKKIVNDKLLTCVRSAAIDCAIRKIPGCYMAHNMSYHPSFENILKIVLSMLYLQFN